MKIEDILTDADVSPEEAKELLKIVGIALEAAKSDVESYDKKEAHVQAASKMGEALLDMLALNDPKRAEELREELDEVMSEGKPREHYTKRLELRKSLQNKLKTLLT